MIWKDLGSGGACAQIDELCARRRRGRAGEVAANDPHRHAVEQASLRWPRCQRDGVRATTAVVYALGGAVWRLLLLYRVDERADAAVWLRA